MSSHPTPHAELLFNESDAVPMSTDPATVKPWSQARACLETAPKAWLSTVRPDGRPHTMPVMPVWAGLAPCIAARPTSRKARNLTLNDQCVLTVSDAELDLVLEGTTSHLRDPALQREAADAFLAKFQWAFSLRDGIAVDDSLPGSPEYAFYRITPVRAYGYGSDGLTATRWLF
ncbi:pyridoxamine 5'-phosphate oxidase family protein [Nonomuraea sp. NPDC050663]|uniref:pyridoxamine 5'-phosphate oxidase family protein n=1 Tax=Nonomuraea sp. NPDC050663 TaxID=3364370 RepID=UPI0037ADB825